MKQASIQAIDELNPTKLQYSSGERRVPFTPSNYPDDAALIKHIKALSAKPSYLSLRYLSK